MKMTIFDALRLLGEIDLLQEALKLKNGKKIDSEDNTIFSIIDDVPRSPIVIRRPPPFYISHRLEGWIINNCMIYIKVAITIIPRAIAEAMKLYIT